MSDVAGLLSDLAGEDEWSRHQTLERLRKDGLAAPALTRLRDALDDDADASRRSAARMALAALGDPESPAHDGAQRLLRDALDSPHVDLRVLAASALGESGSPEAARPLIGALHDPDRNVVAAAADALGVLGHAAAIAPLSELADSGEFWLRAAAVVSLGRMRDPRAIPALARVAGGPGLEQPVVEALRSIDDPQALPVLEELMPRAGLPALLAAGALFCSHPDLEPPAWVADAAGAAAEELKERLDRDDDPAAARLLGIAAPPGAVESLLDRVAPPRFSEAALGGVLAAPPEARTDAILARLDAADPQTRATLLALLPPVAEERRIQRLIPFLDDPNGAVRAAAAESLARAPVERALPLLEARLDRAGAAPEVLRAMGGLGSDACLALTPLLEDTDPDVRRATADALARCAGPDVADRIAAAVDREEQPRVRAALLRAWGHTGGRRAVERLSAALADPAPEVRMAAIEGLAATGDAAAVEPLRSALRAGGPTTLAALRALGDLAFAEGATLVEPFLTAADPDVRRVAAGAAVPLAAHLSPGAVAAMARDDDEWVRICGARALARRGPEDRRRVEVMASGDPAPDVRAEARRALDRAG